MDPETSLRVPPAYDGDMTGRLAAHFASWASCSRQGIRLSSRSACRPAPRRRPPDPDGVSTFHTHEIRPDRVSSLPRGRRCSYDHRCVRGRRLPPLNGRPLPPRYNQPTRDVRLTRHQQGFSVIHPFGLPLAGDTRSGRAPLGFPLSFAPSRYRPRTSGRGQVWNTDPSHVFGVTPNLQSTNLLITCDIVSQRTHMPRTGRAHTPRGDRTTWDWSVGRTVVGYGAGVTVDLITPRLERRIRAHFPTPGPADEASRLLRSMLPDLLGNKLVSGDRVGWTGWSERCYSSRAALRR